MVRGLFHALRRRLNVLALPGYFRSLGVVVHHIPRSPSTGGVDILLDGGGDEIFRGGVDFALVFGVDIS